MSEKIINELIESGLKEDLGESDETNPCIIVHKLNTLDEELGEAPILVLN